MENIILKKIIELGEESKLCNEPNAATVLFALAGSIKGNMDYILAEKVQEFIKNVMLPNLESQLVMNLFEQLAEDLNPTTNAELIRQAEIEAQIKQIQNEN